MEMRAAARKRADGSRKRWLRLKVAAPLVCFRPGSLGGGAVWIHSPGLCFSACECVSVSVYLRGEMWDKRAQTHRPLDKVCYLLLFSGSDKSEIPRRLIVWGRLLSFIFKVNHWVISGFNINRIQSEQVQSKSTLSFQNYLNTTVFDLSFHIEGYLPPRCTQLSAYVSKTPFFSININTTLGPERLGKW